MPAGEYIIKLTVPYAATFNHEASEVPTLFDPPIGGSWAVGIAVNTLK
mgnify:FL=1